MSLWVSVNRDPVSENNVIITVNRNPVTTKPVLSDVSLAVWSKY